MKKIIVVGHKNSNYQQVELLLQHHGMAPALSSRREGLTPQEISEALQKFNQDNKSQAIGSSSEEQQASNFLEEYSARQLTVNPMWNGLAMDLMLSNMEQEFWGWADPKAVHLLNYWSEIDPLIHFVFVYDKPQSVLVHNDNKTNKLDEKTLADLLGDWEEYNKDILHFFHRNKNRCVLINGEQMIVAAEEALIQVKDRIEAPWKELNENDIQESQLVDTEIVELEKSSEIDSGKQPTVSDFIALSLIKSKPETLSLYEELQASANLPLFSQTEDTEADAAIHAWNDMVEQERLLEEQQSLSKKLTENIFEAEKLAEDRHYLLLAEKEARKESNNRFTQQIETLSQQSAVLDLNYQSTLKESEELLAQLHSVQETLETYHLDKNRLLNENEKLQQARANLENEQNTLIQKQQNTENNLLSTQEKLQNIEKDSKDLEAENELLLSQLHQAQVELERYYLENKTLKAKPPLYGAADRIRQQLTYRIGVTLLENSRSFYGWLTMPCSLVRVTCQFRKERRTKQWTKLPPINQYQDAYDIKRIKSHLSYRLGEVFLTHIKNPLKWFILPAAIKQTVKEFRQSR
ncbi:hypothetical protein A1D23_12770 [Chelonobacter oris]|uniref:hypothetical protein n=1 Tax=Chelonobacter oris TaxID=505317 RepID=UPI002448D13A|nr:hypothetical protein [Chelonobacter oris]MDH3001387.1 hypothetical protein [Chelonobacter oris]